MGNFKGGKMALVISEKETRELIDMKQALKVVEQIFHDRAGGKSEESA